MTSAAGRRLAEATVTLQKPSSTLPALGRPMVNLRHFPRLSAGRYDNPSVHELIQSILDNPLVANVWIGNGPLSFLPAPGEELADLKIERTGAGFRGSLQQQRGTAVAARLRRHRPHRGQVPGRGGCQLQQRHPHPDRLVQRRFTQKFILNSRHDLVNTVVGKCVDINRFRTIGEALGAARTGALIGVQPGTYDENLVIHTRVTLTAAEGRGTGRARAASCRCGPTP